MRIMDAAAKRLELPLERMASNIGDYRQHHLGHPAHRPAPVPGGGQAQEGRPGGVRRLRRRLHLGRRADALGRWLRIIAGTLKGRRLQAPRGDLAVRPTADRAREALFSILQRWPQGPFLDLFAGTGAVALEAWSRGYGPVACVERDPAALACLKANARGTGLRVLARDAQRLPADAFPPQAVVFADPPYEAGAAGLGGPGAAVGGLAGARRASWSGRPAGGGPGPCAGFRTAGTTATASPSCTCCPRRLDLALHGPLRRRQSAPAERLRRPGRRVGTRTFTCPGSP